MKRIFLLSSITIGVVFLVFAFTAQNRQNNKYITQSEPSVNTEIVAPASLENNLLITQTNELNSNITKEDVISWIKDYITLSKTVEYSRETPPAPVYNTYITRTGGSPDGLANSMGRSIASITTNGSFTSPTISGDANFSGNVGIGTTTPNFPLTVAGKAIFGNQRDSFNSYGNILINHKVIDENVISGWRGVLSAVTVEPTSDHASALISGSLGAATAFGAYNPGYVYGGEFFAYTNYTGSTQNVSRLTGSLSEVRHYGSGTVTQGRAISAFVNSYAGTITDAFAGRFGIYNYGGTITRAYGIYLANGTVTGTTGTKYGFYTEDLTGGAIANYAIYTNQTASSTNSIGSFAIYNAGTAPSYFAGSIGLGTTSPSAKLAITQSANSATGGLWIAETGNTDFRSIYMDTNGVMSFYGGDTAGALNTATLNSAGAWTNASDISYKENIINLSDKYTLETLMKIQPRFYTMKGTNLPQIGFIAQELEQIIPEVVDGKDGSKGISYGNLVAMVVSAVQELNNKIESFFNSLKELVKTKEVQTEKLCVGQICIDEQGLRNILESQNVVNIISPTVNLPEPTESSTTTPAEVATSTLSEIDEPAIIENNETASSTIDE